jgi:hypothetical protein
LWEVLFSGDPMHCAGFVNTNATDSQCAAICGVGPKGQAVVSCYVGISNNPAGAFQLVCKGPADTC